VSPDNILQLLGDGDLERALEAMVKRERDRDDRIGDDALLLQSRLRTLEREADLGKLTQDAVAAQRAQITQGALRLARKLPPEPAAAPAVERAPVVSPQPVAQAATATPPITHGSVRTVRLFLASSAELRADRDAFDLYVRQQNDHLRQQGIYFEVVRWEHFLDAMSETRLQDAYNEAVRNADVFVSLFFTKTGAFTSEEFEVAHRSFKATGKPRIYTYFKDAEIRTGNADREGLKSLWAFKDRLKALGHFVTQYESIEDLKLQFRGQLDRLDELLG